MDSRKNLDGLAVGVMVLLCMLWSLQQISLKAAADDVSPMLMVALRSAVAALLVAGVMAWRGERVQRATGRWRPGLGVGLLFALEYLFVAEALRHTHASHVVVFLYTSPIFAAVGLHLKLPAERLRPLQWAGIAVAFGGIALAFGGRGGGTATAMQMSMLWGDLLALAAGASWGATTVLIRCSRLSEAPAAETLLYQLLGACVLLGAGALVTGQTALHATPAFWAHLGFQALIVSFASFLVWFWLLRHYLASRLGVLSFLTPILGVVFGAWLLAERLDAAFVAGAGLVLAGVLVVSGHALLGGGRRWPRALPGSGRAGGL
ncbi:DMT family transporter [Rubrivivax gelatinosus]|uniref:Putative transmembrane protein n=1 Tax=Rubrivivax gelatinosus (strain NBRC 100245 / IL144) TaxID=983917 RepID=I0HT40_RUBGI|nr:DMT family transporter [Rubrivivax gelatinosus]BAL96177.1 putative transmembrane protein [Rubrivivax gelatinosus IL144]